jgi:hypothetical protein
MVIEGVKTMKRFMVQWIIVLLIYFFLASNRLTTWPYMISAIAETNAIAPK